MTDNTLTKNPILHDGLTLYDFLPDGTTSNSACVDEALNASGGPANSNGKRPASVSEGIDQGLIKNKPNLRDFQDSKKIFIHHDRVQQLRDTGDTVPVHLTVGLTNYCQHKCPWCYINFDQAGANSQRSGAGDADRKAINADDRLIEAVLEAKDLGLKAITFVGDGEPTLHKKFAQYAQRLSESGLDLGIFSNLSTRKKEVLDAISRHFFFVRCSLDSANADYHKRSHGTDDFDLIINNIRYLVKQKRDNGHVSPVIGIQYVTNRDNFMDLPDAAELYRDLGVDYMTIKPMYKNELNVAHKDNDLTFEEVQPFMMRAEKKATQDFKVYAKYSQFMETLGRKTNNAVYYKKCLATPLSPYLDENGNVEMCGNLKGRGFTLGNIYEQSFADIWFSEHRKRCLAKIDLYKCPAGCRLDPLNKTLWDTLHPDTQVVHPNFV